jgi:uncharacterized protein (TIGR02270 family)
MRFLPDVAEEHLEELAFLWTQRRRALRSAAYTPRAVAQLDERIEAHLQGLLVLGADLPAFVAPALGGDDGPRVFAAAFALLRSGASGAERQVGDVFATADGVRLVALADALRHTTALADDLVALAHGDGLRAALAAEVLAFRGTLAPAADRLAYLAGDDSPVVRACAWRTAAYAGMELPAPRYEAALADEDATVRAAALEAALWARHAGFLPACRAIARRPTKATLDGVVLYAAVAGAEELAHLGIALRDRACGPARLRVAGAFGHPALVEPLLTLMAGDDAPTAAAAGAAFEKIAGVSVESGERATVPPAGADGDEFEQEFAEEVMLPDAAKAREHWARLAPRVASAHRVCRGHDVSAGVDRDAFGALDMESRWELCARARFNGQWQGSAAALEAFPIRR